jgi:hypothetical protein
LLTRQQLLHHSGEPYAFLWEFNRHPPSFFLFVASAKARYCRFQCDTFLQLIFSPLPSEFLSGPRKNPINGVFRCLVQFLQALDCLMETRILLVVSPLGRVWPLVFTPVKSFAFFENLQN